ncbi:MAG: oxygenase MpaB family protein [Verrucomicrobiae bacterium]|nr:oxygenase MpaB family protein [Verrucomicrobiae bacterium]
MQNAEGNFGPGSMMWKINREQVVLVGGPAAAILQVAHPRLALAVAEHSRFQSHAFDRLRRTLDAVYTVAFGTREESDAVARHVEAVHRKVVGEAAAHGIAGPARYSAFEPDIQYWVLATLVMTAVRMYERFVCPLTGEEKQRFLLENREFGRFFGVPENHGPETWTGFEEYYEAMVGGDMLGSHALCAEMSAAVACPKGQPGVRLLAWPFANLVPELIPAPLNVRLGLPSTALSRTLARVYDRCLPPLLRALPPRLRYAPRYLQACRRLGVSPVNPPVH